MLKPPIDRQLVLKTTPPRLSKLVLERERLRSDRPEFADKAVVFLEMPSGSGKTSLLGQWRKEALQVGSLVVWLTLGPHDSGNRMVMALTVGMRSASGKPQFGVASLRSAESSDDPHEAVTCWLAEVAELATETVLILDDAHLLPEETTQTALAYLLLNAPANLKIYLASRRPINLPLAQLPARGRFTKLQASDLRLSPEESITLLKARFGTKIDSDSCIRLHELTEGWPLGLQLAISTVERHQDIKGAVAAFSLSASEVEGYFIECLVDQLPVALMDDLVRLSCVDTLSASLSEAILGRQDIADTMTQLRELTPIYSEGVNSEWFRLHALAKQFLLQRFEKLPEVERKGHFLRAGQWMAEHHFFEPAARYLLLAGQSSVAYDLITQSLRTLLGTGQVSQVVDWLERLPAAEISRSHALRIVQGWVMAQSERNAEVIPLLSPLSQDASVEMHFRCESAEICATAAIFADDLQLTAKLFSGWEAQLQEQPPELQLIGTNILALISLHQGAPDQVRYAYTKFQGKEQDVGPYALRWRDWIIGYSYLWAGHIDMAIETLSAGLAKAESESGRRSPTSAMLASALAIALVESNAVDKAAQVIADRLDVLERRAPPEAIAMGFMAAARIAVCQGDEQRAFDILDHLHAMGESRKLPRLSLLALGESIRLHAHKGRIEICGLVAQRLDTLIARVTPESLQAFQPVVDIYLGLAQTYVAIAKQNWKRALEILTPLVGKAKGARRGRESVQIYLLQALAMKRMGEDGQSLLLEALEMAKLGGYQRIIEDAHPDLLAWARQLDSDMGRARHFPPEDRSKTMPAPPSARSANTPRVHVIKSSLLSPKESEVLQLLAGNMSNKQIALAMGVSDETVKWHLKNLFGKLNAGTRKHLLDRAMLMGILE